LSTTTISASPRAVFRTAASVAGRHNSSFKCGNDRGNHPLPLTKDNYLRW
jgi:hypothetical protein